VLRPTVRRERSGRFRGLARREGESGAAVQGAQRPVRDGTGAPPYGDRAGLDELLDAELLQHLFFSSLASPGCLLCFVYFSTSPEKRRIGLAPPPEACVRARTARPRTAMADAASPSTWSLSTNPR